MPDPHGGFVLDQDGELVAVGTEPDGAHFARRGQGHPLADHQSFVSTQGDAGHGTSWVRPGPRLLVTDGPEQFRGVVLGAGRDAVAAGRYTDKAGPAFALMAAIILPPAECHEVRHTEEYHLAALRLA